MELMTKAIEAALPPLYSTDGKAAESPVIVKYFTPDSNWTWYAIEGEKTPEGDFMFFGLVDGFATELGNFTLSQLESANGPMGLPIERDLHFDGHLLGEFMDSPDPSFASEP